MPNIKSTSKTCLLTGLPSPKSPTSYRTHSFFAASSKASSYIFRANICDFTKSRSRSVYRSDAVKRRAKWTILLCRRPEQSSLTVSRFVVIAASRLEWRSTANPAGLDCSPLRYSSILRSLRQTAVPRRGRRANIAGRFCAGAAGCC